ncbi:MAG: hypothetical protein LBQ47_04505 [Endomicrobium sp.]|jgi:thiamine-phosphate pyrophosphorylase|nr:hypothetical protein [Endomicrobium sp.]
MKKEKLKKQKDKKNTGLGVKTFDVLTPLPALRLQRKGRRQECLQEKRRSCCRIIDANLNRCREGLRVVEDCLRYVLDDTVLYKKTRAVRHETDKILRDRYAELIKERDIISDGGRRLPETDSKNLSQIIISNFKRAQESLRVLEEYSKTVFPKAAQEFKKQRYAAYDLEKAVYLKYKTPADF